jgi:hypothetical protein
METIKVLQPTSLDEITLQDFFALLQKHNNVEVRDADGVPIILGVLITEDAQKFLLTQQTSEHYIQE